MYFGAGFFAVRYFAIGFFPEVAATGGSNVPLVLMTAAASGDAMGAQASGDGMTTGAGVG